MKKPKRIKRRKGVRVIALAPVWRRLLRFMDRCPVCDEECEVIQSVIAFERTGPREIPFWQLTVHHTTNKEGEDIAICTGSGRVLRKKSTSYTVYKTFPEVAIDSEGLRKAQRWA